MTPNIFTAAFRGVSILSFAYSLWSTWAIRSELVKMIPPDPHVRFLPRPRLKNATSPRVPSRLPLYLPPIACAASPTTNTPLSLHRVLTRSTSEGSPRRCMGKTQRVRSLSDFSRRVKSKSNVVGSMSHNETFNLALQMAEGTEKQV